MGAKWPHRDDRHNGGASGSVEGPCAVHADGEEAKNRGESRCRRVQSAECRE